MEEHSFNQRVAGTTGWRNVNLTTPPEISFPVASSSTEANHSPRSTRLQIDFDQFVKAVENAEEPMLHHPEPTNQPSMDPLSLHSHRTVSDESSYLGASSEADEVSFPSSRDDGVRIPWKEQRSYFRRSKEDGRDDHEGHIVNKQKVLAVDSSGKGKDLVFPKKTIGERRETVTPSKKNLSKLQHLRPSDRQPDAVVGSSPKSENRIWRRLAKRSSTRSPISMLEASSDDGSYYSSESSWSELPSGAEYVLKKQPSSVSVRPHQMKPPRPQPTAPRPTPPPQTSAQDEDASECSFSVGDFQGNENRESAVPPTPSDDRDFEAPFSSDDHGEASEFGSPVSIGTDSGAFHRPQTFEHNEPEVTKPRHQPAGEATTPLAELAGRKYVPLIDFENERADMDNSDRSRKLQREARRAARSRSLSPDRRNPAERRSTRSRLEEPSSPSENDSYAQSLPEMSSWDTFDSMIIRPERPGWRRTKSYIDRSGAPQDGDPSVSSVASTQGRSQTAEIARATSKSVRQERMGYYSSFDRNRESRETRSKYSRPIESSFTTARQMAAQLSQSFSSIPNGALDDYLVQSDTSQPFLLEVGAHPHQAGAQLFSEFKIERPPRTTWKRLRSARDVRVRNSSLPKPPGHPAPPMSPSSVFKGHIGSAWIRPDRKDWRRLPCPQSPDATASKSDPNDARGAHTGENQATTKEVSFSRRSKMNMQRRLSKLKLKDFHPLSLLPETSALEGMNNEQPQELGRGSDHSMTRRGEPLDEDRSKDAGACLPSRPSLEESPGHRALIESSRSLPGGFVLSRSPQGKRHLLSTRSLRHVIANDASWLGKNLSPKSIPPLPWRETDSPRQPSVMNPSQLLRLLEESNRDDGPATLSAILSQQKKPVQLSLEELGDILCHVNRSECEKSEIRWDVIYKMLHGNNAPIDAVEVKPCDASSISAIS